MNTPIKKPIILLPGEILNDDLKNQIKAMNYGKPKFKIYCNRVQELFNLNQITMTENKRYFLAGFIEGEGSISISIKKNKNAKFGIELDPAFNITQHINGVNHLYSALMVFQTGRIRYKEQSNATLVFIIEPRKSLTEKVVPFYEKYVYGLSSPAKKIRFENFKKMLELFDDNAHLDKERLVNELLPIWDSMRVQHNARETFKNLNEAQEFVRNYKK